MLDQLGDAGGPGRQALHDPQPIDVGEGPVEQADLTQLVGLVDDGRNGRADPNGGRAQDRGSGNGVERDGSTLIYINRG